MIGLVIEKHLFLFRPNTNRPTLEREAGIEPAYPTWKDGIITVILFPRFGAEDQARTGHPDLGKVMLYRMSYFRR